MTDHWAGCYNGKDDPRCQDVPYEEGVKDLDAHIMFGKSDRKYEIEAPCNYVSNAAYYHSVTRICDYPHFSTNDTNKKALK